MNECVFCKIVSAQIPAATIYEDDKVIAFLDIKPINPGHALVVPREHFESFLHLDPDTLARLIAAVHKVAKAVMQATGAEGFNIGLNNGSPAGQVVPHVHFHVMPRNQGDGYVMWKGKEYRAGEIEATAQKIIDAM